MSSWKHKLAAIFYGPSWQPGKSRLGLEEDKIKVNYFAHKISTKAENLSNIKFILRPIKHKRELCGLYSRTQNDKP